MRSIGRGIFLHLERLASPIGTILLLTDAAGAVRALDYLDYEARMVALLGRHYGPGYTITARGAVSPAAEAIAAYFAGDAGSIDGVATATGGTDFQRAVWQALRAIPAGTTASYGRLAAEIGRPGAVRAAGAANGANPIGIIVPCHRVIGANGALTGYGGGLPRKRWLLAHEAGQRPAPLA